MAFTFIQIYSPLILEDTFNIFQIYWFIIFGGVYTKNGTCGEMYNHPRKNSQNNIYKYVYIMV